MKKDRWKWRLRMASCLYSLRITSYCSIHCVATAIDIIKGKLNRCVHRPQVYILRGRRTELTYALCNRTEMGAWLTSLPTSTRNLLDRTAVAAVRVGCAGWLYWCARSLGLHAVCSVWHSFILWLNLHVAHLNSLIGIFWDRHRFQSAYNLIINFIE